MANEVAHAPNKTWELSLYELHRTPQEAITDNTEIAVSPRSLHSELMCPICLDMLKNTMTTKECLHRFCQDCIITALRSGNKECPTCRKKLVSKRSLRPDPNFDALISKIYPSRDEYEAHQERVLAKLNKHHSTAALTHSIEEGLRLQALNRAQRVRKHVSEGDLGRSLLMPPMDGVMSGGTTSTDTTPRKKLKPYSDIDESSCDNSLVGEPIINDFGEAASNISTSNLSNVSNDVSEDHFAHGEQQPSPGTPVALEQPCVPVIERTVPDIELVFKPHPQEGDGDGEEARYIKTTANATGTLSRKLLCLVILIHFRRIKLHYRENQLLTSVKA